MAGAAKERRRESGLEARRRIEASNTTWNALEHLADDLGVSVHDLAQEAFEDLLRKHRRPRTLREALRESARQYPAND